MTPEGSTKARIKALLTNYNCYFFMPVQTGYGKKDLDFICARERSDGVWESFWIEAKAHGCDPSPLQWNTINGHRARGRKVFICDDQHNNLVPKYDSLKDIQKWLDAI